MPKTSLRLMRIDRQTRTYGSQVRSFASAGTVLKSTPPPVAEAERAVKELRLIKKDWQARKREIEGVKAEENARWRQVQAGRGEREQHAAEINRLSALQAQIDSTVLQIDSLIAKVEAAVLGPSEPWSATKVTAWVLMGVTLFTTFSEWRLGLASFGLPDWLSWVVGVPSALLIGILWLRICRGDERSRPVVRYRSGGAPRDCLLPGSHGRDWGFLHLGLSTGWRRQRHVPVTLLPDRSALGRTSYDPGTRRWTYTARGPQPGHGKYPRRSPGPARTSWPR